MSGKVPSILRSKKVEIRFHAKTYSEREITSNKENLLVFDIDRGYFKKRGAVDRKAYEEMFWLVYQQQGLILSKMYYNSKLDEYYSLRRPVDQEFVNAFHRASMMRKIGRLKNNIKALRAGSVRSMLEKGAPITAVAKAARHTLSWTKECAPISSTLAELKAAFRAHPKS